MLLNTLLILYIVVCALWNAKHLIFNTMAFIYLRCIEPEFYILIIQNRKMFTLLVSSHVFTRLKNLSFDFVTAC